MFALCSLALPEQITTQLQNVSACVGDNISLPSFVTVSALADNVEVVWFRVAPSIPAPAENGAVTSNYSYELHSVTTLDEGRYYAEVKVPTGKAVDGPRVDLIVVEKPGRFPRSYQNVLHVQTVHVLIY